MRLRKLWLGCAGLLALLAPTGCFITRNSARPEGEVPALPESATQRPARELPVAEQSTLCLATAERLYKNGQDLQAAVLFEKARTAGSRDPRICRRLAVLYGRLGDAARSRDEFQKAIAAHPRDADLCNDMGYLAYSRGQMQDAETVLRQALQMDPNHRRATINLALVLAQQSRYQEAMDSFLRVLPEAQAHSNLAFIYSAQGKRDQAIKNYRLALRLDPDMPVIRTALAKLEGAKQDMPARQDIRLASHSEPAKPEASRPQAPRQAAPRPLAPLAATPMPATPRTLAPLAAIPMPARPHPASPRLDAPKAAAPQVVNAFRAATPVANLARPDDIPVIEVVRGDQFGGGYEPARPAPSPLMERTETRMMPPRPLPLTANERRGAMPMPSPTPGW